MRPSLLVVPALVPALVLALTAPVAAATPATTPDRAADPTAPAAPSYRPAPASADHRTPLLGLGAPAKPKGSPGYATGALTQVSASTSGAGANGDSIGSGSFSPDGRYFAFWSNATNLVPGVTEGTWHLYVKGVAGPEKGQIGVFDTSPANVRSNDVKDSFYNFVTWRPDGKELLFSTGGTNLVDDVALDDGNGPFLVAKDLTDGSTGLIAQGVNAGTWSPDQKWIAFGSRFNSLCDAATSSGHPCTPGVAWVYELYAWKVGTDEIVALSADSAGRQHADSSGPTGSDRPSWSADSKKVAFVSYGSTLVPGDTNTSSDVFVKTVASGAIVRASTGPGGRQANNASDTPAFHPRNPDQIAFSSTADNLVPGDDNSAGDVFVRTLSSNKVVAVSTAANGKFPVSVRGSRMPKWSPDGKRIAFTTQAFTLVGRVDKNTFDDVYVKNIATKKVTLVSVARSGKGGNSDSTLWGLDGNSGGWAPNGKTLVLLSASTNFGPRDNNAFQRDLFAKVLTKMQ